MLQTRNKHNVFPLASSVEPSGPSSGLNSTAQSGFLDHSTPPPSDQLFHEDDRIASLGVQGTLEILKVIRILEGAAIPCCVVGVSALIFYGADIERPHWEICVPTNKLYQATLLLQTVPHNSSYAAYAPAPPPQMLEIHHPRSLAHTFPHFHCTGMKQLRFQLIPSDACHLECDPANFRHSLKNGLPYPRLEVLIQSLLDMRDVVALADVVDGADISEEWGVDHLDLAGTNDVEWARRRNELLQTAAAEAAAVGDSESESGGLLLGGNGDGGSGDGNGGGGGGGVAIVSRRELWREIIHEKVQRISGKYPEELYATRYRLLGSEDPWLVYRECS